MSSEPNTDYTSRSSKAQHGQSYNIDTVSNPSLKEAGSKWPSSSHAVEGIDAAGEKFVPVIVG